MEGVLLSGIGGLTCVGKNSPTPCYVVDETYLLKNLEILSGVMQRTGCRILLAQKAFSMYALYPLIGQFLSGTTASGLYEARLGAQEMGKENHIFSPAYREEEFDEITHLCDHIVFNSFAQLQRFQKQAAAATGALGCASIRSAPRRKDTQFMIPVPLFLDWASQNQIFAPIS